MNRSFSQPERHLFDGTVWVFLAEALILPTGLVTAAFLTRRLGPEGYGLFTIAATIVIWLEVSITALFSRPSFKFIAEAADWKPLGATLLWLHLVTGAAAAFALWLLSPSLARLLQEPSLAPYLRLFALDIPLFCVAQAHKNLLVGLALFRQRAFSSTGRWIGRLLLVVILVECGLSVHGAILGSIGASLIELIVARRFIRPPLANGAPLFMSGFWDYAWPLLLFSIGAALFGKLDLLMLKALGGSSSQAGIYGAAQNLAVVPGIFAVAFSPLLLSTLSRLNGTEEKGLAKQIGSDAIRTVILLLPFAAATAGMASEIAEFTFGPLFAPAAPVLAVLIFGAVAMALISVATAIITAAGKRKWPLVLIVSMLGGSAFGYPLLIPIYGSIGASIITTVVSGFGALAAVLAVCKFCQIRSPMGTLQRSCLVSVAAFLVASLWAAPGLLLFVKVPVIAILICASLILIGEFSADEIALVRSALHWRGRTERSPVRSE
jgi:O-antigen/teichoic acid export membrane protein